MQFLKCALSAIFTWEKLHGLFVNLFHLNTRRILTMQTLNCNKWLCILKFAASYHCLSNITLVIRIFNIFLVVIVQLPTDATSHCTQMQNISGCINVQLTLSFHIFEVLHCNNFLQSTKLLGSIFTLKLGTYGSINVA